MTEPKLLGPEKLTVYPWGEGIADVRYFTRQIMMPTELETLRKTSDKPLLAGQVSYVPQVMDFPTAVESLELTLKEAPPGLYFAANPLEGTYGKWLMALKAAGWTQVPGCALNRVWGNWQAYKGPGTLNGPKDFHALPWYSPDGFHKWIHAFYKIVPGREKAIEWDFTEKTRNLSAYNGDADMGGPTTKGSLWHINYGGSGQMTAKYSGRQGWCPRFGRLSKSCGIAMGHGLPECGADLDEEFYTIAALEVGKKWPKGWTQFLEYGGMTWAHNLRKLDTAQVVCPHALKL